MGAVLKIILSAVIAYALGNISPSIIQGKLHGIDIKKEGKDILIGFNPRFLMDVLRVVDDEVVTIYMINSKSPCFIKDKEESYIYLILPVNCNAASV